MAWWKCHVLFLHENCLLSGGKEAGWARDRNGCVGDQRRQKARPGAHERPHCCRGHTTDGYGCGNTASVRDSRTVATHTDVRGPGLLFLHWHECGGPHVLQVARPSDAAGCLALHPSLQIGLHQRHPPLYSVFLSKLSTCIFEWDAGELALLREAKPVQLGGKGMAFADVSQHITRKELEKHCRRCTRGTDNTTILIQALIDVLDSPSGCNTTGMRLSNRGMSAASRTSRGTSCTARLVR